jgi:hypothetical protein
MKKPTRGGKRENAGKKPKYDKPLETLSLAMTQEAIDKATLEAKWSGVSRGEWVQGLILRASTGDRPSKVLDAQG